MIFKIKQQKFLRKSRFYLKECAGLIRDKELCTGLRVVARSALCTISKIAFACVAIPVIRS